MFQNAWQETKRIVKCTYETYCFNLKGGGKMDKDSIAKMLELLKLVVDCEQTEKITITFKLNKKSPSTKKDSE